MTMFELMATIDEIIQTLKLLEEERAKLTPEETTILEYKKRVDFFTNRYNRICKEEGIVNNLEKIVNDYQFMGSQLMRDIARRRNLGEDNSLSLLCLAFLNDICELLQTYWDD